ncbi:PA14 domain-containing protein [Ruegeria profundi]|uniref:PA14 domain-containing protein n=1 Tax=Ruegeria profundi TaxID=1685378 RepID=UPI003C7B28A4
MQDIAENLSRAPAISAEDPTRSTLHTGEQAQGVLDEAQTSGGAPPAGVNFAERTVVEEGVETGIASVPQSVVARAGSPLNTSPSGESGQSDHQERVSSAETTVGPLPTADISAEFPDVTPEVEPNAPTLPTIPAVSPPQPQEEQNQAPKDVMLDGSSLTENDEGAVVGTITVFDPDSEGPHQFEVSDPRFEIVDGQLRLKPGVALDHEDAVSVEVDVTVTDEGGLSLTERFTIDVANVNEGPEKVSLDSTIVAENAMGASVGNVTVVDPDLNDAHSYEISVGRFEISDGQLRLRPGISLDYEGTDHIEVSIKATDAGGLSVTETFSISVQDINEAPMDLTVQNGTENLIRNGSFEEFDLQQGRWRGFDDDQSGAWTDANGIEIWDRLGGLQASDGDQVMEMDHGWGMDSISQVVQTQEGQLYDLGFDLRERLANGTDTVEVFWNDTLVAELDPKSSDWETFQLQVVGTGQDKLELREAEGQNDSYGALVDNITLTETQLAVAEHVAGAVIGQVRFDDPDHGDTHRVEVSDDRFEVIGGQLRLKPDVALDRSEAEALTVDVTVVDEGGLSTTETFSISVADRPDMSISTGFHAKYFDADHGVSRLEDVNWDAPAVHQEVTTEIDYEVSRGSFLEDGSRNTFGVEVSGTLQVSEGGTFTFHLGADEGAMLFVDGIQVINEDDSHGYQTRTGQIGLEPGAHAIEVRYFENSGEAGLKLEWDGPGLDGQQLVSAPDVAQAQVVAGTPLAFDIDTVALEIGHDTLFSLDGLPPGTQVEVDGQTHAAGPDGTVEMGSWQGGALTIEPPFDFSGPIDVGVRSSTPTELGGRQDALQTVSFEVHPAQVFAPTAQVAGGFQASYFDVESRLLKLDDIDWSASPSHQEIVAEIHYKNSADSFWEGGSKDTFGARLEGRISVEEGGIYTFFAGGDDGVVLFVNGVEVIENDGLHAYRTRAGQIELDPGTHDIEVRYFENYGHAGLKLEWDGPDTEGRALVQADPGLAIEENGTLALGIDLTGASDQADVAIEGLPANSLIVGAKAAVMSDGGPVDVSGWDIGYLEISPPPGFEGAIEGQIVISDTGFNGAPVTSTTAFSMEVGDVDALTKLDAPDEFAFFANASGNGDVASWDADSSDAAQDDTDDVLNEDVISPSHTEITSIETEAYERVDW